MPQSASQDQATIGRESNSDGEPLTDAAIAGILIAVFFACLGILLLAIRFMRMRRRKRTPRERDIELSELDAVRRDGPPLSNRSDGVIARNNTK